MSAKKIDTDIETQATEQDDAEDTIDLSEVDEKIRALMQELGIDDPDEINDDGDNRYRVGSHMRGQEYLVLTDSEADAAHDKELDSYIEELVMPEIPERLQGYFDEEAWKRDARMDGRGHSLATYDGNENEQEIDGTTYYIYRTN